MGYLEDKGYWSCPRCGEWRMGCEESCRCGHFKPYPTSTPATLPSGFSFALFMALVFLAVVAIVLLISKNS